MARPQDNTPLLDWKSFSGMESQGDTDIDPDAPSHYLDLASNSYVVAITGVRGGGKTIIAVWLAAFYMVNYGFPVWSNVAIKLRCKCYDGKTKLFESQPLDVHALYALGQEMQSGIVLIDEAPMFVDSRNALSLSSRLLNYAVMQTRKRSMSIIYTTQNFKWVDSRLQWSTDVLIRIKDMAKTPWGFSNHVPTGESFTLDWWDVSGAITGKSWEEAPWPINQDRKLIFNGKQFWPIYDTWAALSILESQRKVRIEQTPLVFDGEGNLVEHNGGKELEAVSAVVNYLRDNNQLRMGTESLQEAVEQSGITLSKEVLGKTLKQLGVRKQKTNIGYDYILPGSV